MPNNEEKSRTKSVSRVQTKMFANILTNPWFENHILFCSIICMCVEIMLFVTFWQFLQMPIKNNLETVRKESFVCSIIALKNWFLWVNYLYYHNCIWFASHCRVVFIIFTGYHINGRDKWEIWITRLTYKLPKIPYMQHNKFCHIMFKIPLRNNWFFKIYSDRLCLSIRKTRKTRRKIYSDVSF